MYIYIYIYHIYIYIYKYKIYYLPIPTNSAGEDKRACPAECAAHKQKKSKTISTVLPDPTNS